MKGQSGMTEVTDCPRCCAGIGKDLNCFQLRSAVPDGGKSGRIKNFPAVGIGNIEWKTAVGIPLIGFFHPLTIMRCRTNVESVTVDDVTCELHGNLTV